MAGRVPPWNPQGVELLTCRLDDPETTTGLAASLVRVAALLGR